MNNTWIDPDKNPPSLAKFEYGLCLTPDNKEILFTDGKHIYKGLFYYDKCNKCYRWMQTQLSSWLGSEIVAEYINCIDAKIIGWMPLPNLPE